MFKSINNENMFNNGISITLISVLYNTNQGTTGNIRKFHFNQFRHYCEIVRNGLEKRLLRFCTFNIVES